MPWARFDDKLHTHRKIVKISNDALAVWTCSIIYSGDALNDGELTRRDVAALLGLREAPPSVVDELVAVGLWDVTAEGYVVHDFLDYNYSREQVLADRAGAKERRQKRASNNKEELSNPRRANVIRRSADARANGIDPVPGPGPGPDTGPVPEPPVLGAAASDRKNATAVAAPVGATSVPETLKRFQDRLKAPDAHAVTVVGEAFREVFGGSPDFPRLGRLVKEYGAPFELIRLMFQTAPTWNGVDDALSYLTKAAHNRRQERSGSGRARSPDVIRAAPTVAPDIPPLSPEEEAEAIRQAKAHRDALFVRLGVPISRPGGLATSRSRGP